MAKVVDSDLFGQLHRTTIFLPNFGENGRRARGMVRGLGRRSRRYSVRHDVRFA